MSDSEKLDLILTELLGTKEDIRDMKDSIQDTKNEVHGLKTEMQSMKGDIQTLKTEVYNLEANVQHLENEVHNLKANVQHLENVVHNLETDVQDLKTEVQLLKKKIIGIEIHLEESTDRNIQLLAENFIDLVNKLNQAVPAADKSFAYEVKVTYLIEEVAKLAEEVARIRKTPA